MFNNSINNKIFHGFQAFNNGAWNLQAAVGYTAYSAHAANTYIVGMNTVFDTDSSYNPTTGVYTIPKSGIWHFDASINANGQVGGVTTTELYLQINNCPGQAMNWNQYIRGGDAHMFLQLHCSCLLDLTLGETVVPIYSWTGTNGYQVYSTFSGFLI